MEIVLAFRNDSPSLVRPLLILPRSPRPPGGRLSVRTPPRPGTKKATYARGRFVNNAEYEEDMAKPWPSEREDESGTRDAGIAYHEVDSNSSLRRCRRPCEARIARTKFKRQWSNYEFRRRPRWIRIRSRTAGHPSRIDTMQPNNHILPRYRDFK